MRKKLIKKLKTLGFASLSTILFFALWYAASAAGLLDRGIIPDPVSVLEGLFVNLFTTDLFRTHIAITLQRAFLGFLLALAVGVGAGFALGGVLKKIKPGVLPLLHFLEKMNPLALFPVFMLFWGIGETSKVLLLFWVAVWPILFHTIEGLQNVESALPKSARAMGAGKGVTFGKVLIPAASPDIFAGIRLGVQVSFIFVISVEILSSSAGLGWFINNARHQYNLPNVYSGVLLVAIIGIIICRILGAIEKKAFAWKEQAVQ
jgi:NitT/TauT family transport system permease protein